MTFWEFMFNHFSSGDLFLCLVIVCFTAYKCCEVLSKRGGKPQNAKSLAKASDLAGHQPIGAHVDEHRAWRK